MAPLLWPLRNTAPVDLLDVAIWRALGGELHVCDPDYQNGVTPLDAPAEALAETARLVATEGYFQAPPQPWGLPIAAMAGCVARLKDHGLSPVFAFVYDEFWSIFSKADPIIRHLLGGDYLMLPDFWVWHVDTHASDAGWRPHRDKGFRSLYPDGRPKSFTLWIPLTDADTHNACMYIVPADRDPTYGTPDDNEWKFVLPDVRALPAKAGSLLGWTQAALHWGSRGSPRASHARISMAFEFQRADEPAFNEPLIRPCAPLPLETRLQLICKQILQYRHMYPMDPAVEAVATAGSTLAPWPGLLLSAAQPVFSP
jgi:hypothetical protein